MQSRDGSAERINSGHIPVSDGEGYISEGFQIRHKSKYTVLEKLQRSKGCLVPLVQVKTVSITSESITDLTFSTSGIVHLNGT